MTIREYAKRKNFAIVGKLTHVTESYGIGRKQRVYVDEAGNKYYPDKGDACGVTIITIDGRIL